MVAGRQASVAAAAFLGASGLLASPARPNLLVTRLAVSQRGLTLRIRDTVRNVGAVTSPPSTVGYYLGRQWIGARRVGPLQPHAGTPGSIILRIAPSVPPGSYRLRACTNDHRRIRLSRCRAAARAVNVPDGTPPVFAGLTQATTCIPGPIGPGRSSPYQLRWTHATDDATPPSRIVYDIYQATSPGGENFTAPTYTSTPGATTFTTPLLPSDQSYYFVVRARDQAGNRASNTVERQGMNQCL
jgi:hypothetical protein